jgi:hypothetical protein
VFKLCGFERKIMFKKLNIMTLTKALDMAQGDIKEKNLEP